MTKSFYSSAILLTGIYVVVTLSQSVMFFRLGTSIYNIPSIASWSVFVYVVTFLWSLVMLKYYYDKQYQLAFWTLAAWTVASLVQFWFFYNLLATRELSVTYMIATFLLVASGIVYAASLTFSASAERLWLKVAGTIQLLLGMIMATSFIWAMVSISARMNGTIAIIEQWIGSHLWRRQS